MVDFITNNNNKRKGGEKEEKEEGRGEEKELLPFCLLNLVMVSILFCAHLLRQAEDPKGGEIDSGV